MDAEKILGSIQKVLLDMIFWFDNYCQENSITYYVAGGTLIGTVRHGGFIPWDDDIDIILPRSDYEKFIRTFDGRGSKYELETPYSGKKDFLFSYAKLYDTTTTLTENTEPKCTRGVYIDLFPLDGIGNVKWEDNYNKFDQLNMLLMTRTCVTRKGRGFLKNLVIIVMRIIPQFILNNKKLSIKVDKAASKIDYKTSEYVGNLMGAYRIKEIMRKDIFGQPKRYKFESIYVNGPEKYDEYLTHIYGDWRQLPPEDKRHGAHSYLYVDLDHSYKDKQDE